MNLKERMEYISEKLDYLGFDKKHKKRTLRHHYGIFGRIKKSYVNFERDVEETSEIIKYHEEVRDYQKKKMEILLKKVKWQEIESTYERIGQNIN